MAKFAKKIADKDNVATAVSDFSGGEAATVRFGGKDSTYTCNQEVPFGHKIAIADIKAGEKVYKYGESIGTASADIRVGDWVHTHNVKDDYKCLDKQGAPLPGQEDE